jgi:hypothetical protein
MARFLPLNGTNLLTTWGVRPKWKLVRILGVGLNWESNEWLGLGLLWLRDLGLEMEEEGLSLVTISLWWYSWYFNLAYSTLDTSLVHDGLLFSLCFLTWCFTASQVLYDY